MKLKLNKIGIFLVALCVLASCKNQKNKNMTSEFKKGSFGYDLDFLKKHYKNTLVLSSADKKSSIVLSPELQGRVMTSTLNGEEGRSFGWLNYDLIASQKKEEHFNPTGGEERFWLGPEGGQYAIFFAKDKSFEFKNWYVPAPIDTEPFKLVEQNEGTAIFERNMHLVNYSGTEFNLNVERKISLLSKEDVVANLGLDNQDFSAVAYQTENILQNTGDTAWKKETGLLSVWILCMMQASPEVTVVAPIQEGSEKDKGIRVNDDYFGKVSSDRLKSTDKNVFFKADANSRGKIGFSSDRATSIIGSYDAQNKVLTISQMAKEPNPKDSYVNSAWELQKEPYVGDVLNSYNDGPLEDGARLGNFYELESSSPALALAPKERYNFTQRMYHFKGSEAVLNQIAKKLLGVSLEEISKVF